MVLDADVIIHFAKGGYLNILPEIFKEFDYVVLDKVYNELNKDLKGQLDKQMYFLKNIKLIDFNPSGEIMYEYFRLLETKGDGESACLAYCRFTNNVIGSSNLKDTSEYCKKHRITYLATIDFLYYAIKRGFMTITEAENFISEVVKKGSLTVYKRYSNYLLTCYYRPPGLSRE